MTQNLQGGIDALLSDFNQVRKMSIELFRPLKVEDAVIQSDIFGSPPNWHLAHVTWFFQKVLEKYGEKFEFDTDYNANMRYLNSYYQRYGDILPKADRGRFPRPTVEETLRYRELLEERVARFLEKRESENKISEELHYDIQLAIQHEMQHQELLVFDLQHYFERFPDPEDNYKPSSYGSPPRQKEENIPLNEMVHIPGGLYDLGFSGDGFCYDNELPEHRVYLEVFKIDVAPVTNAQYMDFIKDGGYLDHKFWLADGWDLVQDKGWNAPLYWVQEGNSWVKKDFRGLHQIVPEEPVVNVSYYEADAYSKWAGKRLPTEAEWEKAASWNENLQSKTLYPWGNEKPSVWCTNLLESFLWGPTKIGSYHDGKSYYGCHQMLGDVWEWTSSEYVLYPGFKSRFFEYTDKWAINQKVLKGGSFATPSAQISNSYRNYFKPHERIVFAGFRCASEVARL